MLHSAVVHLRGLVRKVIESIPLRRGLGVEMHLVIRRVDAESFLEVDDLVVEGLALVGGDIDAVKAPVDLDALAGADFGGGLATTAGVRRLRVPRSSWSPQTFHAQPCGMPRTAGMSSKSGRKPEAKVPPLAVPAPLEDEAVSFLYCLGVLWRGLKEVSQGTR